MFYLEPDRRIAVLIDAENVSPKYIKHIFDEIAVYGTPTYKRIYGDWTKPQITPWKEILLKYSIMPVQQYSYTAGKNASDSTLIIDAMDILYSKNIDGFCIISSDSDFTRLAARLRESGMFVMGMGEQKTPVPFITACEKFKYLEILSRNTNELDNIISKETVEAKGLTDSSIADTEEITAAIQTILAEKSDEDGWAFLGEVGNMLSKRYPDFDTRNYGFSKLTPFISSLKAFEIMSRKTSNPHISHKYIRVKSPELISIPKKEKPRKPK